MQLFGLRGSPLSIAVPHHRCPSSLSIAVPEQRCPSPSSATFVLMVLQALALPESLVTLVPLVLLQALALPRPLAPMAGIKGWCSFDDSDDYIRKTHREHGLMCELVVLEKMLLASGMTTEEVIENRAAWRQYDPIVGPPSPGYLRRKRAQLQMPLEYKSEPAPPPRASRKPPPPATSRASSSFEPPPPATTRASSSRAWSESPPPVTPRAWSESPPPATPLLPLAWSESPPPRKARRTS